MSHFSRHVLLLALFISSFLWARVEVFGPGEKAELNFVEKPRRGSSALMGTFYLPQIQIQSTEDGFQGIEAGGLLPQTTPGQPDLSGTGSLIAIPPGYRPVLRIESQETKSLTGIRVRPFQRTFRCRAPKDRSFSFDSRIYRSSQPFPSRQLTIGPVGSVGDLKIYRLGITPFQWNPRSQTLSVLTQTRFSVDFVRTSEPATPIELPLGLYEVVKNAISNSQLFEETVRESRAKERMLVIVADDFRRDIQDLLDWKASRGLEVDTFTYSQAGGTNEKVRTFIKNEYTKGSHKPTYLLLVGNKTTAPGFMESTASGSAASDYRFSLVNGDDDLPDLLYGRLLADNSAEVHTQVQRWIDYESRTGTPAWLKKATTIASDEGYNPSDVEYAEQIAAYMKKVGVNSVDAFYEGKKNATPTNITAAISEGRLWASYIGHGTGTAWASTNGFYSNSEVATVENAGRLPIVIDVACQNGSWVKLSQCFGKTWMTLEKSGQPAGAVAYYGGSVNISWHPPAVMSVGTARARFEKSVFAMGAITLAGQLYLIEKMGKNEETLDNLKWYNLFSDPSLSTRF